MNSKGKVRFIVNVILIFYESTICRNIMVCLPIRGKRQRNYLIFCLFHFDVELVVRQRDKNHAISRNCTCTIFSASLPGIKNV